MTLDAVLGLQPEEDGLSARRRRLPWVGLAIMGMGVFLAIFGPMLAPHDPNHQDVLARLQAPSADHWFGTDSLGRDVLSRILNAARTDVVIAGLGTILPFLIGSAMGALAGYFGGIVDSVVVRLCEFVMALPVYVLAISLLAVMGPGKLSIVVAFTLVGWVPSARLMRDSVRHVSAADYVSAARLGGIPTWRVIVRHIVPVASRPVLSFVVLDFMATMITVAAFSYLGLGIQPPASEWGAMISDAQPYIQTNWWLVAFPASMIALLGLGCVLVGNSLTERSDYA